MNDREMLEKAAKAAGIDLQWIGEGRMAACSWSEIPHPSHTFLKDENADQA